MNGSPMVDVRCVLPKEYLAVWRRLFWEAHNGVCGICNTPVDLQVMVVDHIHPKAVGGPDVWENLQPAHRACNTRKGSPGVLNLVCPTCTTPFTADRATMKYCTPLCRPTPRRLRHQSAPIR